jgi:hypothetical protein
MKLALRVMSLAALVSPIGCLSEAAQRVRITYGASPSYCEVLAEELNGYGDDEEQALRNLRARAAEHGGNYVAVQKRTIGNTVRMSGRLYSCPEGPPGQPLASDARRPTERGD